MAKSQDTDPKPEEVGRINHEHRTRFQAMNKEGSYDDSGYGIPWNPQGQHRDVIAADTCVIGRFRGDHTLIGPLSERS